MNRRSHNCLRLSRFFVAIAASADLLLCAKHLFVAAIGGSSTHQWRQDSRSRGSEHFPVVAQIAHGAAKTGAAPAVMMAGAARLCERGACLIPIRRLELAQREIDRVFGSGHAEQHPEVVVAVMQTAASDWAASRLAVAIERVAVALLAEERRCRTVRALCGPRR